MVEGNLTVDNRQQVALLIVRGVVTEQINLSLPLIIESDGKNAVSICIIQKNMLECSFLTVAKLT